jgi:RNA polymerase sigma-70 factor, ECF subfamily
MSPRGGSDADFVMDPNRQDQSRYVEGSIIEPALPRPDFRRLFEQEVGYVLQTLRRLGVARADVEDMAHEVFLAVLKQLDAYDPSRPLKPWLFGFAFRIASQYRRKARHVSELEAADAVPDRADGPDALLEKGRKRQLVQVALDEMELDRRAVFVLHDIDGFTGEEVSRTLSIPLGTVYSRLRLARDDFSAKMRRLQARGLLE